MFSSQFCSQAEAIVTLSHKVMKGVEGIQKVSGTSLSIKLAEYRASCKQFPKILDGAEKLVKFYCDVIGVDGDHLV